MTTKKLTAVPDVDFEIFDYNPLEHDTWLAINALRIVVRAGYFPDYDWKMLEVATKLEEFLREQ